MIIGLTGQTGAGKSTVSDILRGETQIAVINADLVARQVVSSGTSCLAEIALTFTIEVLNADGTLNRKKLAELVFNDKEKLKKLNAITFPHILAEIKRQIATAKEEGKRLVVIDAPTLFESRTDKLCDKIITVIADEKLRRNRIIKRDWIKEDEANARMNSQHDDEYYTKRSDIVINNSGDIPALRVRILEILSQLGV